MQYKIVQANDADKLSTEVERLLNDGWALYGDLVLAPPMYAQALTNEHDSGEPLANEANEAKPIDTRRVLELLKDTLSQPEDQPPGKS